MFTRRIIIYGDKIKSITHLFALFVLLSCFGVGWPLFGLGLLFSVLPDIDYPKSWLGRLFPFSAKLNSRVGHRTVTHSALFLGLSYIVGPAAFLGALSHVLLDLLTPSGVQLAWPQNTSYVILGGPVKTGSRTESSICLVLLVVSVWLALAFVLQRSPLELIQEVLVWFS